MTAVSVRIRIRRLQFHRLKISQYARRVKKYPCDFLLL